MKCFQSILMLAPQAEGNETELERPVALARVFGAALTVVDVLDSSPWQQAGSAGAGRLARREEQLRQLDRGIQHTQSQLTATDELLRRTDQAGGWWASDVAVMMSGAILLFAVIILSLATYLIRRGVPTDSVLKIFGAILIVVSAIFLVVAGYSDQQIAPVIGLLGTIAGYLLGKESGRTEVTVDRNHETSAGAESREGAP